MVHEFVHDAEAVFELPVVMVCGHLSSVAAKLKSSNNLV